MESIILCRIGQWEQEVIDFTLLFSGEFPNEADTSDLS